MDVMFLSHAGVFSADVEAAVVWLNIADNQRTVADVETTPAIAVR